MILDNDVRFDKDTGRYYLTQEYIKNKLDTDLDMILDDTLSVNPSKLADYNIEYVCDMLYDYIENNAVDKLSTLYDFTKRKSSFIALKKALGYQMYDYLQNGDTSYEKGGKVSDTVNNRAIQLLLAKGCFHIRYSQIPEIERW